MKKKLLIAIILSALVVYGFIFLLSKEKEKMHWSEAQKRGTIEVYIEFLKLHPRSSHARDVDRICFSKAADENTISAFEDYLKTFPEGLNRENAQRRIEQLNFDEADNKKTILGYEEFMKIYPGGEKAALAESRIQTILEGRQSAWKDVKTAKILLSLSFPEGVQLPFFGVAKRILECSGIAVIESDGESSDAVLTIEAHGSAEGDRYEQLGFLYTGASLNGTVTLEEKSGRKSRKGFRERKDPEVWLNIVEGYKDSVIASDSKASGAPFLEVFDRAVPRCLLEMTADLIGEYVLVFSLDDGYDVPEANAIRRSAAEILSKVRNPRTTELLIDSWADLGRDGRALAAQALGEMKNPRAFDLLIDNLQYDEFNLKRNIIIALGKMGDPRAVEYLIPILQHKNVAFRENAIDALGAIGDNKAIESLIDALRNEGERYAAAKALQRITGLRLGQEYDAWSRWWGTNKEKYLDHR
jgi:hypothetical protein